MKTSKNLGATKACPSCKKTIIKSILFSGTGTMEMKCPHCQAFVKVELGQKNTVMISIIASLMAILLIGSAVFLSRYFHYDGTFAVHGLQ